MNNTKIFISTKQALTFSKIGKKYFPEKTLAIPGKNHVMQITNDPVNFIIDEMSKRSFFDFVKEFEISDAVATKIVPVGRKRITPIYSFDTYGRQRRRQKVMRRVTEKLLVSQEIKFAKNRYWVKLSENHWIDGAYMRVFDFLELDPQTATEIILENMGGFYIA